MGSVYGRQKYTRQLYLNLYMNGRLKIISICLYLWNTKKVIFIDSLFVKET